jgi:hypothetical protein
MKSFFGNLWRDIQIGVRLLTPFEGAISLAPGGSIVVTVLNILTMLNKVVPASADATKAALAAAMTLPNHPTADPVKLEAAIAKLLAAAAPIGGSDGAGLRAVATVEQLASTAGSDIKKRTASLLMNEITQTTVEPTAAGTGIDNTVTALNEIAALV